MIKIPRKKKVNIQEETQPTVEDNVYLIPESYTGDDKPNIELPIEDKNDEEDRGDNSIRSELSDAEAREGQEIDGDIHKSTDDGPNLDEEEINEGRAVSSGISGTIEGSEEGNHDRAGTDIVQEGADIKHDYDGDNGLDSSDSSSDDDDEIDEEQPGVINLLHPGLSDTSGSSTERAGREDINSTQEQLSDTGEEAEEDEEVEEEDSNSPTAVAITTTPVNTLPDVEPVSLTEEELENLDDEETYEEIIDEGLEPEPIDNEHKPPSKPEVHKKDPLQELTEEKKLQKKIDKNRFLEEYSKSISRSVDEVAHKLQISSTTATEYLNEYIAVVKEAVMKGTYPEKVLQHFNEGITNEEQKIKYWHTDQLKGLVKRYSRYDINASLDPYKIGQQNKTLNNDGNDTFISKNRVAQQSSNDNNSLSLLSQPQPQPQQQVMGGGGAESFGPNNDVDQIHDGMTSLQLIRFGLTRVFGQGARIKIGDMIGNNPTPYLLDEQKMMKLLRMFAISQDRAEYFIDWLKTNARYVAHPEGFLAYGTSMGPTNGGPIYSGGISNGSSGVGGSSMHMGTDGPYDMTDYYYKMGIFQQGFPPSHPVNQAALREYKEQERENKQMKSLDQKINMYVRTKMLDAFDGGGKNGQGNSMFSPEMMLMFGMAEYRQVKDENGNMSWVLTPKMPGMPNQGVNGVATSPTDQMASMMNVMKEMMGFMASMNKTNTDPTQQTFMTTVMNGLATKMFEQPQSKVQEVIGIAEMLQKLKGPETGMATGVPTDPETAVKIERMKLDKEFGMRRLDLQQQELQLQRDRLATQDREANKNLETLLEGVQQFAPMVVNMFQQFMMGNKGGAPPGGQVGMAPGQQPGGGAIPQTNPAEILLKMEYQKQQERQREEAERKRQQWEEEQRRRAEEAQMYPPQPQPPQPQKEVERVIIKEVPPRHQHRRDDDEEEQEEYDESKFAIYAPEELEMALEKANKQKRKIEAYMATVGTVLQNKILNGDEEEQQPQKPAMMIVQPPPAQPKQEPQKDFGEMLDSYPSESYDPDYTGQMQDEKEDVEITTSNEDVVEEVEM